MPILRVQELCRNAAKTDGYKDIILIQDPGKSGTSLQKRKGIQEIIDLAKRREISIMYVAHSDRMARNVVEHAFFRNILRSNGVELKYLNGQSSSDDAASVMADNMFASINQYHSDNTREKTKQSTDKKARAGYLPTHAPIGYLNCDNPDTSCEKVAKKIIIPNPKTGPLVTEAFKLYATGQYNVYELNEMLHDEGLTTNRGKKITPSVFYNLLKNRLYLGEIHWQNIHVKNGKHQPLIDETIFNRVQAVMFGHTGNRCRRRKFFWLLNGYVFCPIHNRRYTAEWHLKKSIAYYHCPCGGCGRYIEKSDLEKQVADKFKNLQFDPVFVKSLIERLKALFEEYRNGYHAKHRGFLNQKNAWEKKLEVAEDRMLDGTLSKADYTRIREEMQMAVAGIDAKISKLGKAREINIDSVSEILDFTRDAHSTYMRAPERLQKRFIDFFFDRFEVKDGVIIKNCYSPLFDALVRENVLFYKTTETRKTIDNKVKSDFIIRPTLGAVVEDVRTIFERRNDATIYIPALFQPAELNH